MIIVGLTGGIAAGKSTVLSMFAARGALICSADQDSRDILSEDDSVRQELRRSFPDVWTPEGEMDRARLGARIFASDADRLRLETLMHPAIIARMTSRIAAARAAGPGLLVYETPLLYEARMERLFDIVVAVLTTPEVQRQRLQERQRKTGRDPLTEEEITGRLAAQIPPEEKARRADFVLRTDTSLEETEAEVRDLYEKLMRRSA